MDKQKEKKKWYKCWWAITLYVIIFLSIISSMGDDKDSSSKQIASTNNYLANNSQTSVQQPEPQTINYSVIYSASDYRYDGAMYYWVLIDEVDVTTSDFKQDIESLVRSLIKDKGKKISVAIFDQRSDLDLNYKQDYLASLGRAMTQTESSSMARHMVATFDGELRTNLYPNQLSYFPYAIKSTPEVGKYVSAREFN